MGICLSMKVVYPLSLKSSLSLLRIISIKPKKTIHIDNRIELVPLKSLFSKSCILHQTTIPYTPQKNGRVERKHYHVLNVARALAFKLLSLLLFGENVLK